MKSVIAIAAMFMIIFTLPSCRHCPPCTACNTCYAATPPFTIHLYNFSRAEMDSISLKRYTWTSGGLQSIDSMATAADSSAGTAGYTISVPYDFVSVGTFGWLMIYFSGDTSGYQVSGSQIKATTSCIECSGQPYEPASTLQSYYLNGVKMSGLDISIFR